MSREGDREVLVDRLDAGSPRVTGRAEAHAVAVEEDLTIIGLQRAGAP